LAKGRRELGCPCGFQADQGKEATVVVGWKSDRGREEKRKPFLFISKPAMNKIKAPLKIKNKIKAKF
jgi:hypothetical protein